MADDDDPKNTIDITSPRFDAFTALYSKNVNLPCPNAPVLDNLSKFRETEEGILAKTFDKTQVKKQDANKPSTSKPRFLPHQEPVPGRAKRAARTVLTRMKNVQGPLALLQKCMDQRIRVKVVTRNMAGVRGYCLGYLVAFDKHFNLALQDVTEVWTRKKHQKTPALGTLHCCSLHATATATQLREAPPQVAVLATGSEKGAEVEDLEVPTVKVVVRSSAGKTEECERHVPQLLMRGEHVVTVIAQNN